jgi:hypothetical protein
MNAADRPVRGALGLTERGRVRAVLVTLEQRWDGLHPTDRSEVLDLLEQLAAYYRRRLVRVPLVGRLQV